MAGRAEIARAEAEVLVMRDMYRPMATIRTGPAYTMAEGRGWMAMVGVSLPIWRGKLRAGVAEAQAMRAMSEADVQAMTRMIEGDAAVAVNQLQAARDRQTALTSDVLPRARMVIEPAVAGYASGQLPLVSVIEAVQALWLVQSDLIAADTELGLAWARLGRAIGLVRGNHQMTPFTRLRRFAAPMAAVVVTAAVFTVTLWAQHSREAWPFAPRAQPSPDGDADSRRDHWLRIDTHDRVPIDVTASTLQQLDIRLELVKRESLTEEVRAVATVVPDESADLACAYPGVGMGRTARRQHHGRDGSRGTAARTHFLPGTLLIPDRVPRPSGRQRRPRASRASWSRAVARA